MQLTLTSLQAYTWLNINNKIMILTLSTPIDFNFFSADHVSTPNSLLATRKPFTIHRI